MPACSEVSSRNEPGCFVGDQLSRQFAREMESGFKIHRMHPRPGLRGDAKRVIGFAPRRRGAVHEMRHAPERAGCFRQQRIARGGIGEIADPGHRQFRPGRGLDGRRHRLPVHIGKHRAHALADQGLRDRAADPVARAGDERRLARGIEWIVEQAHVGVSRSGYAILRTAIELATPNPPALAGPHLALDQFGARCTVRLLSPCRKPS